MTTLIKAVANNYFQKVRTLLSNGYDINEQNSYGKTALMVAALRSHAHIVELLITKGANLDKQDDSGSTALIIVSGYVNLNNIARLLIDKGANLDKRNKDGNTALILASDAGNTSLVELLITKGADIKKKNRKGDNAFYHARKAKHIDTLELLLRAEIQKGSLKAKIQKDPKINPIPQETNIVQLDTGSKYEQFFDGGLKVTIETPAKVMTISAAVYALEATKFLLLKKTHPE